MAAAVKPRGLAVVLPIQGPNKWCCFSQPEREENVAELQMKLR